MARRYFEKPFFWFVVWVVVFVLWALFASGTLNG